MFNIDTKIALNKTGLSKNIGFGKNSLYMNFRSFLDQYIAKKIFSSTNANTLVS